MGRQREEKERMTMERVRYTLSTQIIEITMKDKRHHRLIARTHIESSWIFLSIIWTIQNNPDDDYRGEIRNLFNFSIR